jgi:hypothetical protein
MIDFELAFRNSEPKIPLPSFGGGVILSPTAEDSEETNHPSFYYDDQELMRSRWSHFVHNTDLLRLHPLGTLTRDSYILLPARVYGYVLLSRKWCMLLHLKPYRDRTLTFHRSAGHRPCRRGAKDK